MPRMRRPNTGLGDAIYYALTGKHPSSAERMNTRQKTEEMMNRYQDRGRVAQILGVTRRTVDRWLSGKHEAKNTRRAANADKLNAAHRDARVSPGKARLFGGASSSPAARTAGPGGLTIRGRVRVSQDVRDRVIEVGKYMPPDVLQSVVEQLRQQGPDAAEAELTAIIQYYYNVPDLHVESVEWIEYE